LIRKATTRSTTPEMKDKFKIDQYELSAFGSVIGFFNPGATRAGLRTGRKMLVGNDRLLGKGAV
jgi:hypothetical protein